MSSTTDIMEPLKEAQVKISTSRPHLVIAIDTGASSIKVVGSLAGADKCYPFSIEPQSIEITNPSPNPDFDENSVWVTIGETSYALGNLAIVKYNCPLEIKPLKIKSIVPKLCAAIAVLHRKFNLPSKFDLSISTVLPPGEFIYSTDLATLVSVAFRKIITPAGVIKPVVRLMDVKPEGFGVLDWHRSNFTGEGKDVGVIMFGFRNASVLFSRKGELNKPKSSSYGFHAVLERISALSGGNYPEQDLIVPVWRYLMDKDESGFKRVATDDFGLEMSKIRPAIKTAVSEYCHNLEIWLKSAMQQTDVIVLAGGNADYIGKSMDGFLQQYVLETEIGYPIYRHIGSDSIPEEINATGMANRFLDIYCLWSSLNNSFKVKVQKNVS
jgi:hypothetical protein